MCLILQETRFQVQVLKSCKFVQESSNEVLDFKTRQLSIEVYESRFFRVVFHPIHGYMFGLSFLITLNNIRIVLRAIITNAT